MCRQEQKKSPVMQRAGPFHRAWDRWHVRFAWANDMQDHAQTPGIAKAFRHRGGREELLCGTQIILLMVPSPGSNLLS